MYQEIPLSEIVPSPFNPRKKFKGPEFDDMVESIRDKGVLQPILVRPNNGNGDGTSYELVAGERRWRASMAAELAAIPSVVREIDDDTAFEMLMIENLQREDLTEPEEAEGFKAWLDKHGMEEVEQLAGKIKCHPSYIRKRVAILTLPKWVLRAWDKGKLKFGHVEVLARMDNKKQIKDWVSKIIEGGMPVREFRRRLDSAALPLKQAIFDLDTAGCPGCSKNTTVQKELFAALSQKALCQDPTCFKQHTNNQFNKTKKRRLGKYGTEHFCFEDDLQKRGTYLWDRRLSQKGWKKPPEKCRECKDCVTVIDVFGRIESGDGIVCIGSEDCLKSIGRAKGKASAATGQDPGRAENRQYQRAMFFREAFIKEEIPRRIKPDDGLSRKLVLAAMILSDWRRSEDFGEKHSIPDGGFERMPVFEFIMAMPDTDVLQEIQGLAIESISNISNKALLKASELAGIKLDADFIVTKEYLQKMVKAELIEKGRELDIWDTPEVKSFIFETLGKKRNAGPQSLKKTELIRCFVESGVDLAGKVPAEIFRTDVD